MFIVICFAVVVSKLLVYSCDSRNYYVYASIKWEMPLHCLSLAGHIHKMIPMNHLSIFLRVTTEPAKSPRRYRWNWPIVQDWKTSIADTLKMLPQIARFMGPIWGPFGADRTQVGPMLAPWTLLSGTVLHDLEHHCCFSIHDTLKVLLFCAKPLIWINPPVS